MSITAATPKNKEGEEGRGASHVIIGGQDGQINHKSTKG